MKETGKKHLVIGLIAIIGVIILSIVSFFLFNKEKKQNTEEFKLENSCFSNSKTIYCFSDDTVYNVLKINDRYRKTNYDADTYKLEKKSEIDGTFTSNKYEEALVGYVIKEENNKIFLWTTFYDTILEKSINEEYELMDIKNDEIETTKEYITFNIMNNEFKKELSNSYLSVNFKLPFYSILNEFEKDMKTKDGKNAYNLGLRIKYLGEKSGYTYYTTEEKANYAINNNSYQFLSDDKICYSTETIKNSKDFSKKLDKETRQVVIHFCDYMKENNIEITTTSKKETTTKSKEKITTTKGVGKTSSTSSKNTSKTTQTTSKPTTTKKGVAERESLFKITATLKHYDEDSFEVILNNPDSLNMEIYVDNHYYNMDEKIIVDYEKSGENCVSIKLIAGSNNKKIEQCISFTPKKINYELTKTNNSSGCVLHISNKDDKSPSYNDLKNTTCDLKHRTMSCNKLEGELLSPGTYQIIAKNEFGGQQTINVICE